MVIGTVIASTPVRSLPGLTLLWTVTSHSTISVKINFIIFICQEFPDKNGFNQLPTNFTNCREELRTLNRNKFGITYKDYHSKYTYFCILLQGKNNSRLTLVSQYLFSPLFKYFEISTSKVTRVE